MLGWIFFNLHWGGVPKTKCWGGGSKSSIGYRAPFESKKNGADAIKTESITDGIFLRVAPEKFRSFIARSSLFSVAREMKTFRCCAGLRKE